MTDPTTPHVLCIENNPGHARLLQLCLEREGYLVEIARDGPEGRAMYAPEKHEAVTVDYNMPGEDGLMVLSKLISSDPDARVVFMTGYGDEGVAVAALKLGAADYLVKDTDSRYLDIIPSILANVIANHRLKKELKGAGERVRQSEKLFRTITTAAKDAIIMLDGGGKVSYWNPEAERMFGHSCAQMVGGKIEEFLIPPRFAEAHVRGFAAFSQTGRGPIIGKIVEMAGLRKSGEEFPMELSLSAVKTGDSWGAVGVIRDITERKAVEEKIRLASKVFENTSDGVMITNPDAEIIMVNQSFTDITGYGADEVIGKNPRILRSGRHKPEFYRAMWESLITSGQWRGELWNRTKSGEVFSQLMRINAIVNEKGEVTSYVGVFSDNTDRKLKEQHLEHLVNHDHLTRIPNRMALRDRLEQAIARASRSGGKVAILFIDLNKFKPVNDSLGHKIGDMVLQEVGRRLQDTLRQSDTVARFGGDEFVVILDEVKSADDVKVMADKILAGISIPMTIEGHECRIGASVGVSMYPADGGDMDVLLKKADAAMYLVKETGSDGYRMSGG